MNNEVSEKLTKESLRTFALTLISGQLERVPCLATACHTECPCHKWRVDGDIDFEAINSEIINEDSKENNND